MPAPVSAFRFTAPEADLADLRKRLQATRWPHAPESDITVQKICHIWASDFDWRGWEARILSFPNVLYTTASGLSVHALHVRGEGPAPFPILLSHGWPGSFLEFLALAERLAFPSRFGGDTADAFDVVIPSLPGFGFSPPPPLGFNHFDIAELWVRLMSALGYRHFAAQGGDIGASVTLAMALRHPEALTGIHLNFIPYSYAPWLESEMRADEQAFLQRRAAWSEEHGGYAHVQRTDPQTLTVGLNDSPAGLAAWITRRFRDWSPPVPDILDPRRLDHILSNLTLYWLTGSIASACRLYKEMRRAPLRLNLDQRIRVPTAVAVFPHELPMPPRRWVERGMAVARWTEMPRGGHFAALDEPDLLVRDLREFFRPLRS